MYPYKSGTAAKAEAAERADIAAREDSRFQPRGRPPSFRPPKTAPSRKDAITQVGARGLRRCEGGLAYIWLRSGREEWMYVSRVGAGSVYGYIFSHHGWRYIGFDTRFIEAFICFG